jgi:hypothetical protein
MDEKNRLSHQARAVIKAKGILNKYSQDKCNFDMFESE